MDKILIFYGSKNHFNKHIPSEHRNLTDLVYEFTKETSLLKVILPDQVDPEEEKISAENLVVSSDEYSGVKEHVIVNFVNFLAKFDVCNLYLHNPPLQISEQIIRLNIPDTKVKFQEYTSLNIQHLKDLDANYNKKIIGQENAKNALLQSLYPLTMSYRTKPVVLLLYGKSGIGKTETAKYIAETLGEQIFRKQFSMFQNSQFSTYLFGGTHYEKSFAKDLLDRESNVLLLDEFDKANPSFHSAFYQLFDEGIYEDQNYHLELKKSIIICTSNYTDLKDIEKQLGSAIYNRFDNIIHFKDLDQVAKMEIGKRAYTELAEKYKQNLDVSILQRLENGYLKCENVRQIHRLIEGTFALMAIKKTVAVDNQIIETTNSTL